MKKLLSGLICVFACEVALAQSAPAPEAAQPGTESAQSAQNRATSHDRHTRRHHHSASRHHRHRTTAKHSNQ